MLQTASQVVPFLINYDEAQSMVLYNQDTVVACTSLIPPMPDFPECVACCSLLGVMLCSPCAYS